jgi:hypothetical protein
MLIMSMDCMVLNRNSFCFIFNVYPCISKDIIHTYKNKEYYNNVINQIIDFNQTNEIHFN